MLPRLSYFLLFLFLLSCSYDNAKARPQSLQPVKTSVSKQKVLPLAMQYRQQILEEIEASPLTPTLLTAIPSQRYSISVEPERPFELASVDPLFGFMSMQL